MLRISVIWYMGPSASGAVMLHCIDISVLCRGVGCHPVSILFGCVCRFELRLLKCCGIAFCLQIHRHHAFFIVFYLIPFPMRPRLSVFSVDCANCLLYFDM